MDRVRRLTFTVLALSLLLVGCGTGEDVESSEGGNAMPRRAVDQETVSMLVQSQRALQQGTLRKALALADSVVQRAPRLADGHFQRGRVLTELKRFDEADKEYQKVLSLDPQYQGAWFNLGNNAYRRQNYETALRYFQKEQKRHPSASTLVEMGKTYGVRNAPDSARQAYERALARDSTSAEAHARLGQLYEEEGELESALEHSRRALQLDSTNVNYRYIVGSQLFQLGRYEAAIPHLRGVIAERPWHQSAHYNLGQALVRTGRRDRGETYIAESDSLEKQQRKIERLESVAQDEPGAPARWTKLGDAYRRAGRLEDAREAYSIALYLRPSNPRLRDQLAQLSADLGNYEAAVSHYRTLLRRRPDFNEAWFNLGVVYARNGETEKARKVWKRVLKRNPDHQRAKAYLARLPEEDS
ncbi:MAG: tetratricopeptide repeat protein [Salinivenus sp.]